VGHSGKKLAGFERSDRAGITSAGVEHCLQHARTVKTVLILSYYFYPFNHIATQRVAKMAKYLSEYGWQPLILCPEWTTENCDSFDAEMVAEFENANVAKAVPFRRFYNHSRLRRVLRKYTSTADPRILTTWFCLKFNRCIQKDPPQFYYGAIDFLREFLRFNNVDCVWATSPPQVSHALANWVHRNFGIPWVADFRDIWDQKGLPSNAKRRLYQTKIDPRIVGSGSAIVTVSEPLKEMLQKRHKRPVYVIPNGFDPSDYQDGDASVQQNRKVFGIAYTGKVIFPWRDPTPLFQALRKLISEGHIEPSKTSVSFYGTEADDVVKELRSRAGLDDVVRILPRVPLSRSRKIQKQACVLLHLAHGNEKGVLTGKIFEYLGARRPILCIPGDRDCVDALLIQTNAGVICRNTDETAAQLLRWYKQWQNTGSVSYPGREEEIMRYSRKEQARQLATLLDGSLVHQKESR
jgi:glycosyltransferase involved in cell wall biosynthesis